MALLAVGWLGSPMAVRADPPVVQNPNDWSWNDILASADLAALNSLKQAWGLAWDFDSSSPRPDLIGVSIEFEFDEVRDPDDNAFLGYGITEPGRVTGIRLDRSNLTGAIPNVFGGLTELREFNVQDNQLNGPLPSTLGNAAELISLILSRNQFTGGIPQSYENLSKLIFFNLKDNQLSGPLPDFLGTLGALQGLDLSDNQFDGFIPPNLGNLSNLQNLDLFGNELSGPIPSSLSTLNGTLSLGGNYLSGILPANLGSFAANNISLGWNCFNSVFDSESWKIIDGLGSGPPFVTGFDFQKEDCVVIEELDTGFTALRGENFIKEVRLRNTSPVRIHGKLLVFGSLTLGLMPTVFAQEEPGIPGSTEPMGEIALDPNEEYVATILFPIGDMATPLGTWTYDISFEGSAWSFPQIEVIQDPLDGTLAATMEDVQGDVSVIRFNGVVEPLTSGSPIYVGDTLRSNLNETSKIEFTDGAELTLAGNSVFRIDRYFYEDSTGEIEVSLLRGIFMFTSGLIGREDTENININTPKGSIGIRGTQFSVNTFTTDTHLVTEIEVFEGIVDYTVSRTGEVIVLSAGETYTDTGPLPSLETVRYEVEPADGLSLDLDGYIGQSFNVLRSTNLVDWTLWRTVQASELPISLPESSPGDGVFYRLAR